MINQKRLNTLLEVCKDFKEPKITIALPTHRISSESKQDSIAFNNLLKKVKVELEANYNKDDWEIAFSKLEKIKDDINFWNHLSDGLVILACNDQLEIFYLKYSIEAVYSVGVAFHVQPLLLAGNVMNNYFLIDLAKDRVQIYEVSESGLNEIKPKNIKMKFSELYTDVDANTNFNTAAYSGGVGVTHGHREKSSEEDKYREKYFRYLDLEFSKLNSETGNKFILAGTVDNITEFKNITQENFYLEKIIDKPLYSIDSKKIFNEIKELLEPEQASVSKAINDEIRTAKTNHKLLTTFPEIVTAESEGRLAKIFIAEDNSGHVNNQIDELIIHAMDNGVEIHFLNTAADFSCELVAIVHYQQ